MGVIKLAGLDHDAPDIPRAANRDHATPDREWFIGAYVTRELKNKLQSEARAERRTVTQQLLQILTERYDKEENTTTSIKENA